MRTHYEPDESTHQHYRLPRRSVDLAEQHEGFVKNTRFHEGHPLVPHHILGLLDGHLTNKIEEHQVDNVAPPDLPHPKITLGHPDDVFQNLDSLIGGAFRDHTHPYIAIPSEHFESVLSANRLKNQYQTGHSRGGFNPHKDGVRDRYEQNFFDYQPFSEDPEEHPFVGRQRPIYGFIDIHPDDPTSHWDGRDVHYYGDLFVQMNHAVCPHTTLTYGDSLNGRVLGTYPTPYNAVHPGVFINRHQLGLDGLRDGLIEHERGGDGRELAKWLINRRHDYVEAQYHTLVRPSDHFKRIFARGGPHLSADETVEKVRDMLRRHGLGHIPVHPM